MIVNKKMQIVSLYYRECVGTNAIRIALRRSGTVGNMKKFMTYNTVAYDPCFVCNHNDVEHKKWIYIFSWFFTDPNDAYFIATHGLKIIATHYEDRNNFIDSILKLQNAGNKWIPAIRQNLSMFYHSTKSTTKDCENQLNTFEKNMELSHRNIKTVSGVQKPYTIYNQKINTKFRYKNVLYSRRINHASNNHLVILCDHKYDYDAMWNMCNTLRLLSCIIEEQKINKKNMESIADAVVEFQEAYKQVSLYLYKP